MPPRLSTRNRPIVDPPTDKVKGSGSRDSSRSFMSSIKRMMKDFMGELKDVIKTSSCSTANARVNRSQTYRDPDRKENDKNVEAVAIQDQRGNQAKLLRSFNRLKPTKFDGISGPEEAESWLFNVSEKLDLIEAPDSLRPKLAASKLTGFAHGWWRTQSRMVEMNSWQAFSREFENQFISDAYRRRKREELWMLRQEGMKVAEYHQKFESLCLHMDRPSNREKMEAFFFGLRADFRDVLSAYNYQTYKEVVEAAYRRDSVLMEPSRGSYDSRSDRLSYTANKGKKRSGFGDWGRNKKAKSSS